MITQTAKLDYFGRVMLPKPIRDVLNIRPGTELVIEIKGKEVTLRSQTQTAAITARIAALALPVGDWNQMEHEIEAGRLESEMSSMRQQCNGTASRASWVQTSTSIS